ncbi:nuclear transport factor 2 family protein [Neiella marina]|uniref:Nuclear transport factor 2 family protein n=1 Tax=Neiella holothuriorum TaxID=2870530 RepID=A0ABS7EBF2_9GAMM|nr:nuclear transport factor 2 family protein [Neiella holothuriorum]MBW8189663.1 nuclear transport factor 2 family protein [Neiella holothuriorum]
MTARSDKARQKGNKMKATFSLLAATIIVFCQTALATPNSSVVERFVNAFNEREVTAMLALTTSDLRWMTITGEQLSTETNSQQQLQEAMQGYFNSVPSARSAIRSIEQSGPFVYTVEQAFWSVDGVEKSQCSLAVYELTASLIKNVWYFPSHAC